MNPIPLYAENIIYTDTAIETETCSICLDNILSLKEKCDIFNQCKYFYWNSFHILNIAF